MKEVYDYLKKSQTFYLATNEGEQPRVRPFGATADFEGKLYFATNNTKEVFKQLIANPKIEISAMLDGSWIRISGTAVHDDRLPAREKMLEENPSLTRMYSADDGIMAVFYIKDATAIISSFTDATKTITF